MTTVAVLMGGVSGERAVSLRSGTALCQALAARGFAPVPIDYHGTFAPHREQLCRVDVVVPALHGSGGEDGTVQAELEALGVAFVGSGSYASALCMDKWRYKQHLAGYLPTPDGELVNLDTLWHSALVHAPFVLKPNDGGSSIDTIIVTDPGAVDPARIAAAFARNPTMLLERLVAGTEITVGVLGGQALPVVEIIPPPGGVFDYTNKYNGQSRELCPPAGVPAPVQDRAQDMALLAHRRCGCRDLSRTDLIVDPAGDLYVLETNTLPGMTRDSLFPRAAAVAGLDMGDVAVTLVQMALVRTAPARMALARTAQARRAGQPVSRPATPAPRR